MKSPFSKKRILKKVTLDERSYNLRGDSGYWGRRGTYVAEEVTYYFFGWHYWTSQTLLWRVNEDDWIASSVEVAS